MALGAQVRILFPASHAASVIIGTGLRSAEVVPAAKTPHSAFGDGLLALITSRCPGRDSNPRARVRGRCLIPSWGLYCRCRLSGDRWVNTNSSQGGS